MANAVARPSPRSPTRSRPAAAPSSSRPTPAPWRSCGRPSLWPTPNRLRCFPPRGTGRGNSRAALRLHRHTVLYRLEKLKELLGGDLDVPATRLRLQLALDLQKML